MGKSNIFDAVRFLSLLTDCTINDAALQIRNYGEGTGDIADLFFDDGQTRADLIELAAEMVVGKEVSDDFGRKAKASSSFLRYEVAFRYELPSPTTGHLGGLVLERETLEHITKGQATHHLKFPHHKGRFRDSVVYNNRRNSAYISTEPDEGSGQTTIVVHQDGGSHGRPRPAPAKGAVRTIIGTENTASTPTILAARKEMSNWRILALEPSAMRRPDRFTQQPGIAENGAHIPATLQHLANIAPVHGDDPDDVYAMVSIRLGDLVPVSMVRVARDDVRQLLSLELEEHSGVKLRANSISDGTLRFLALAILAEVSDESAVFCMEEPENGIHPSNLPAMNQLLQDIAVDPWKPVDVDNPLCQVIVATHSPYFVQLQNKNDLVLANHKMIRSDSGAITEHLLKCYPHVGTWRCPTNHGGIDLVSLQSYMLPPDGAQIALPLEFWTTI